MRYLIRNGMIADGTGKDCFAGSVLIQDNKIEAVFPGRDNAQAMAAAQNAQVVDAQGGYITPGFIDIHRHGDWKALTRGDDELLCRQGITSVVNGNCGLSAAPQGGAHEEETEHFLRSFIGAKPQTAARADEAEGALPEDPARRRLTMAMTSEYRLPSSWRRCGSLPYSPRITAEASVFTSATGAPLVLLFFGGVVVLDVTEDAGAPAYFAQVTASP